MLCSWERNVFGFCSITADQPVRFGCSHVADG